jgi:DNA-directed RNA polymerase specialized sigma24 family protein
MPEAELAAFYEQVFRPLVRRAIWRHGLSAEDARDIVQDAFVLAIERIDVCGNPKAWLIQVVDHLCLNHSRKAIRRVHLAARWGFVGDGDAKGTHARETSE